MLHLRASTNRASEERMRNQIAATLGILAGITCQCWAGMSVERLRCDYLDAPPLGIDAAKPRRPAGGAEGVTFLREAARAVIFQVDSGIYHFVSTL